MKNRLIRFLALFITTALLVCAVPVLAFSGPRDGVISREAEKVNGYIITMTGESSSSQDETSSETSSEDETSSQDESASSSQDESASSSQDEASSEAAASENEVQRAENNASFPQPKAVPTNSEYRNDMERLRELIGLETDDYVQNLLALEQMIREGKTKARIAYLTFDDGPYGITPDYLAVLDKYNVKAAFFVLGKPARANLYNEIVSRGHTLCNHTYSHRIFDGLYASPQSFTNDVVKLENYLRDVTSIQTNIVRFPGGSPTAKENRPAIVEHLRQLGYGYVDWTAMTGDGGARTLTAEESYQNVMNAAQKQSLTVVLMHDYSKGTLAALPRIITGLREQGFLLLPLVKDSSMVKK